nr:MAG TPA: hypothetical protein [Caudoviricetes sp.]
MKTIMKNLRDMTVVIAAVALFAVIFAIPVPCATAANNAQQEQTYTKHGTIWSEIDGGFTVLDEREQLWAFYADPDSFIVGQEVELVMSDAGTSDYIYDDEVIAVNPVQNPYDSIVVGPLGRYILQGTVSGIYNQHESIWITDQYDEDWFFYGFCPAELNENVILVINANGTPNDFSDDFIEDVLWSDCIETD